MDFGANFLPTTGWTLNNATYDGTTMAIQAGGSAAITLTDIAGINLIPEALKINATAGAYADTYTPTTFIRIKIQFIDNNFFVAALPIINNNDGSFEGIMYPYISAFDIDLSAFTSMEITFYSAVAITLTEITFKRSIADTLSGVVELGETYYGVNISQEAGLVITKSDDTSKAIFSSDMLKMQSGDGTGTNWTDRLYYQYDSEEDITTLVFNGKLSASVIEAVSALITPNLYADKAIISELTVDQLDTSTKIKKYLNSDTSDVNYLRATGQLVQFITATVAVSYGMYRNYGSSWDMVSNEQIDTYYSNCTVDQSTGALIYSGGAIMNAWDAFNAGRLYRAVGLNTFYKLLGTNMGFVYYDFYGVAVLDEDYEQVKNRSGELLYWLDATYTAASATETVYPVYTYIYTEAVKMDLSFYSDGTNYLPRIILGAGSGDGDIGKAYIWKDTEGLVLQFNHSASRETQLKITDFVDADMRRVESVDIDKTAGTIDVLMEGEATPTTLNYTESATGMTITWPDSHAATFTIA